MASGSITSQQINVETVTDFPFLGSKITADGDCSHEVKWCLLLGRKTMTNPDSILKSRGMALPTKVCLVKAVVFLVVMYACESWTIKKAECQRSDAFELWCWRRFLRVPWTARRSNQIILNQSWIVTGRTDAKAETPILWPLDAKNWLIGKDPDDGKDWGQEGKRATEDEMVGWHHQKNQKLGSYWLNLNVSHSVFPWPWVTRVLWLWSSLWVLCSCFSTCKRKELVSLSWNISSCSKTIYSELHQKSLYHIS